MHEYTGAIHIHSVYSDGTGTIDEISKAAENSGLDFIMMTDHNTLKPAEDGWNKWHNNVMIIIGYEINDSNNKNHYLAFGINELIGTYTSINEVELGCKLSAKEYVRLINEKGGIGFIAHPDEKRNHLPEHPSYPWIEETDEYTGIEIWNHMSEWIEGMKETNKIDRFLHPLKSIIEPSKKTLKRWDEASLERHVTGIGGVDAHALKQNVLGFFEVEIFPYKVLFKSIRTHVILDEELHQNNQEYYDTDKKKILEALKKGRCFTANYYNGDAKGFRFYAEHKGKIYHTGDTIKNDYHDSVILRVLVPKSCNIRLIHNGKIKYETNSINQIWNVEEKGIYRIECKINGRGWIYSNHIRII